MSDIAIATRALKMPSGTEYEFYGRTYYGLCTTSANTQTKIVSIAGFTSASLVEGVRVVVCFSYANHYNGTPKLNVSGTGAISIYSGTTTAAMYEWGEYAMLSFVYFNTMWYIENNSHANTTYWGKTKLTNTISNDQTMALTPKAVYDAGFLTLADLPIYDGTVE